ncbi:CAP domain-containing protein [Brevibacillus laterosporus]|uniref:CAP domain-containing protein n=1 Tax=Brevibacillus laterosporus TaxID=1465 RepID=UPI0018CCB028|nr:serine protease [Brevibacillus laterosporus]
MKKKWMSKTVFALAVGMAVSGIATSAFAASPDCTVKKLPIQKGTANLDLNAFSDLLKQKQGNSKDCLPTDVLNNLLNQNSDKGKSIVDQLKNIEDCDIELPSKSKGKDRWADKETSKKDSDKASVDEQKKPSIKEPVKDSDSKENVSSEASAMVNEVVDIVNQERAKAGLKPLSMDKELSKMATDKAKDMAQNNYFDHDSPTFGSPFDMMKQYDISFRTAGENIAEGQRSAEEVMKDWMGSDGHRRNIMDSSFTKIGVGYYNGYWVQEFIG